MNKLPSGCFDFLDLRFRFAAQSQRSSSLLASHHYQGKNSEKDCWINNSRKHFSDDEEELQEIAATKILYCCKKIGMKGSVFFLPEFVFTFN